MAGKRRNLLWAALLMPSLTGGGLVAGTGGFDATEPAAGPAAEPAAEF